MRRVEELFIPEHLRYYIKPSMTYRRREEIVIGADTETIEGEPLSFQFYSEDIPIQEIIWPTPENAMSKFMAFMDMLPDGEIYTIYVHNLKFDLIEFFYPIWRELTDELDFTYGNWHITGVYQRPSFLRMKTDNKTVMLLDSMLWFITSLDNAAELVCPDIPKLEMPQGLGSKRFKKGHTQYEAYAMRDAEVCYHLGKAIQGMHREFEIPQTVSLASMSSTIFKKDFLNYYIPQPSIECIKASYNSYHGGKNNLYPGAAPCWHKNVAALDVSSAYPYAMSQMPAFGQLKYYKTYKAKKAGRYRVPPWGVYLIRGVVEPNCPWPSLFDHGFKPIRGPKTPVENIWVHGMELNEAFEHREFKPYAPVEGFYYDHDRDTRKPALKAFVDHFYKLKNTATNKVQRYTYKIILNSLYGKFIQRREVDLSDDPNYPEKALLAGGLFHPFIASGITAHTRAYMHRLEHRFQALHTATDGIYTKNHKGIEKEVAASNKVENVEALGRLEFEGKGDLLLLRNKLYVLYTNKKTDTPSSEFKGKYILKAALHGYQGSLQQLEHMAATGKRDYVVTKPNTLKDSQNRGLDPNRFQERGFTLNIEEIK